MKTLGKVSDWLPLGLEQFSISDALTTTQLMESGKLICEMFSLIDLRCWQFPMRALFLTSNFFGNDWSATVNAPIAKEIDSLWLSALKGRDSVLKLLLEHKANGNAIPQFDGEIITGLTITRERKHEEVVKLLR